MFSKKGIELDSKKTSLFPGWVLMMGIALLSDLLSRQIVVETRPLLESVTIAILIGLFLRNALPLPKYFHPGIGNYEIALKLGIVFLGIGLSFLSVLQIGLRAITIVILCLFIAPLPFFIFGKKAGLTEKLNILIGIGTTICGSTAIAITAPVIEAKGDEVSYAIGAISLFGMVAMFLFPIVAKGFELNEPAFGLWAGTAIHATPQVVAAGYMYGEVAGQVSTVAKLTRNIFMAPAVFLIGFWYMKKRLSLTQTLSKKTRYSKAIPWFLFGFLAMAFLRTMGDRISVIPPSQWQWVVQHLNETGKFLVLIAMAGVGLNTSFNTMRHIGLRPFLVGLGAAILLAAISLLLIRLLDVF